MFAECRGTHNGELLWSRVREVWVYFEAREGVIQAKEQGGMSEAVLSWPRGEPGARLGGGLRTHCD